MKVSFKTNEILLCIAAGLQAYRSEMARNLYDELFEELVKEYEEMKIIDRIL